MFSSHLCLFFAQGNEATLFSFNATTVDGVFSIRWNMCSAQYTYPNTNGVMVTPNNTKIDVQIANFPYAVFGFLSFCVFSVICRIFSRHLSQSACPMHERFGFFFSVFV